MNDLEHVKGDLPELAELDERIEALSDQLIDLKGQRQEIINKVAQGIARFQVGYEFKRRNRLYRVTAVKGDYNPVNEFIKTPIVWVRYRGVCVFKKGATSREETLYPI